MWYLKYSLNGGFLLCVKLIPWHRNAHDQSQITNVAWLDNSSLVSTGQVTCDINHMWHAVIHNITSCSRQLGFLFTTYTRQKASMRLIMCFRMPTSRSGTSAGQTKRCTIKLPECTVESPSRNIPRLSEILDVQKEQNEASEEARKLRGFQQTDNYMADSIYFGTNFILTLMLVCITDL